MNPRSTVYGLRLSPRARAWSGAASRRGRASAAFTLPELLIASSIFLMLVAAILSSSLYGLRSQSIIEPRLEAEAVAKRVQAHLIPNVQRAVSVRVGTGNELAVAAPAYGAERRGPALQVMVGTNIAALDSITYFFEGADLKCSTNSAFPAVLATGLTTGCEFRAEDAGGVVLTYDCEQMTVGVTLRFDRVQMGSNSIPVGVGAHFTGYEMGFVAVQRGG